MSFGGEGMFSTIDRGLVVPAEDYGITSREIELICSHAHVLDPHVLAVTDSYYDHLLETSYARLMNSDEIERMKAVRIHHWKLLLKADLHAVQSDYLDNIHPRLLEAGFPLSIFTIAADWFAVEFSRVVEKSPDIPRALKHELRIALIKLSFLDLALAYAAPEVTYLD